MVGEADSVPVLVSVCVRLTVLVRLILSVADFDSVIERESVTVLEMEAVADDCAAARWPEQQSSSAAYISV